MDAYTAAIGEALNELAGISILIGVILVCTGVAYIVERIKKR